MRKLQILLLTLTLFIGKQATAQSRFMVGFNAGGNIARAFVLDSLANQFSRRNRGGFNAGLQATYDLKSSIALSLAINYVNKGYKINNDTLGSSPSVVYKVNTFNIPVGLIIKQPISPSSYFHLKAGLAVNYSMRKDSITTFNNSKTPNFRVTNILQNKIYPMFYLGLGIGGSTENGDRYEFSVTYNQSFATDASLKVQYGPNFSKEFPMSYRGGFVQAGFSYYINLGNFKKSDEYFID